MKRNLLLLLTASILFLTPTVNYGQIQPPPPDLGAAETFAVFTAVGALTNDGATIVTGDIGSNVGGVTGFPPGIVFGDIHDADGLSAQAAADVDGAYMYLDGILGGTVIGTALGNGQTLTPDVYILGAASTLDGILTLDGGGDPNAIFIFQIDGAFSTTVNSSVALINGASYCNVYWQINGAVALGEGSSFLGTIVANGAIHILEAASLSGRALSREGAIDLHNNIITNGLPIESTISATGATTFCAGGSVVLSGNVNGVWSTGETTATITVTVSGDYFVTNTDECGIVTSNHIIVTVNALPVCNITGDFSICTGESSELCATPGAASYLWSTGATTNCITVNTAGTYSVTITDTNGCSSVCSQTLSVNPAPVCNITGDLSICTGESSELCATPGAASYLWSTGATTNCITVNAAGTYSVTVTYVNGCSSVCSQTLSVNPLPVCNITGDLSICTGESSELCATPGAASYLWSTGATTNCITVNTAGTYSVTITDANGCSSMCSQTVTVSPAPNCSITGNYSICEGQSTSLCATAGTGFTYLWNTGITTRCISVNTPGTYSVTITNAAGCTSVCSKTVSVAPPPICTIAGNDTICVGQSTQLCAPAGCDVYLWSNGATTRCITVTNPGTYSVTVTNAAGCSSACSITVVVTPKPACTISGNNVFCNGQSTQLCAPTGTGLTYSWDTGESTSCISVDGPGTYHVTVFNQNGCSNTCSKVVTVSPAPNCNITGNYSICEGQSTSLCATAGTGYTYLWNTGITTRCISVNTPGTYSVTITNAAGCSSVCSKTVSVAPPPICTIAGNDTICVGQSTQLCAPAGCDVYLWSNGATTRCITVTNPGTYSVTVTNAAGCSSACSITVVVTPKPACTISGNNVFCNGQSTQLCAPTGTGLTYSWDTGESTSCISVDGPGTYHVTVFNQNGCSNTCSKVVTVSPAPNCYITGNYSICEGQSTSLCATAGTGYTYLWNTGITTRCISVNTPGTYSVTITNAAGCSSVCSKTVSVAPPPICTIAGNDTICVGQSTQLCAPAGCDVYLWSNGATTRCITVTNPGTYSVTVTNAAGCSSACSITVVVTPKPTCTISGNNVFCNGQSTQLCAPTGTGLTYSWDTGESTSCISVDGPGTYHVTVFNQNGCSNTCSKVVTVSPAPNCNITGNYSICEGQSTSLCATAGTGFTYLWNTGITTRCISVNTPGTYSVTITNAAGCTSVCSKTVSVAPPPICTIAGNDTICVGQSTQLCAPAGCDVYLWSNGATTRCITVTNPGTYSVTVTNAAGCSSACSITVVVTPKPACTISGNNVFCNGQSTQLCAPTGTGLTYSWDTGESTSCISVDGPGTYHVTVFNQNGCSNTCSKVVTVSPAPNCNITGSNTICSGSSTSLCATYGAGFTYLWNTGATTRCISVNVAGTYTVTVTKNGCSSTCSKTVSVSQPPNCNITGNSTVCEGQSTQLCAPLGNGFSYLWNTGATTRCIMVNCAGTFTVTVTKNGCTSTCSKTVTLSPKPVCSISGELNPGQGEYTVLCAPAGLSSYQWSTGANTRCIVVNCSGTYAVTITNSNGCTSSCNVCVSYNSERDDMGTITFPASDDDFKVRAYPNPFNSKAFIEFQNMQSNSHVVVELYSLTGEKILSLFDGDIEQSLVYKAEIDAENLSDGIYIYRVLNGDKIVTGKMILIK